MPAVSAMNASHNRNTTKLFIFYQENCNDENNETKQTDCIADTKYHIFTNIYAYIESTESIRSKQKKKKPHDKTNKSMKIAKPE